MITHEADDKLLASLYYDRPELHYPLVYGTECAGWYSGLTPSQKETVGLVRDLYASGQQQAAAELAAHLPPAPECPLK